MAQQVARGPLVLQHSLGQNLRHQLQRLLHAVLQGAEGDAQPRLTVCPVPRGGKVADEALQDATAQADEVAQLFGTMGRGRHMAQQAAEEGQP